MAEAQNTTSLLNKPDAGALSGNDLLWLVQGTGSGRDRKLKLSVLAAYLAGGGLDEMTLQTLFIGTNGGQLKVTQGTGPTISNFAAISAGIIEALQKFVVGNSKWEQGTHGDAISGLVGMESATASVDKLAEKTTDGNIQVLNKLVGNSDDPTPKVPMGAVAADSLEVGGDASVSGDMSVTGDVSAEDMTATGKVTADVGFETNNGDIKSTNGEVSGSTVKATGKLTLGSALQFVIDGTSGHTASDAETWLANTAPQNSLLCVINDMTSGVTLWSDSRQTAIIGKCALLVIKVGTSVYPVIANPNS